jgi:hypothetical protein
MLQIMRVELWLRLMEDQLTQQKAHNYKREGRMSYLQSYG